MWPIFDDNAKDPQKLRNLTLSELKENAGALKELVQNDVAFKFWVPQLVKNSVDDVSSYLEGNMSDAIRNFLLIHCYGLQAFMMIQELKRRQSKDELYDMPTFYRTQSPDPKEPTYWAAKIGKNTAPIKIWVPSKLKQDIAKLAALQDVKPSQYVREIIIARYLGHGMMPQSNGLFNAKPSQDLERWCDGEEINMYEVSEEEYEVSGLRDVTYG